MIFTDQKELEDLQLTSTLWSGPTIENRVAEVPIKTNTSTDCLEFLSNEMKFQWASSCNKKNQFACRKCPGPEECGVKEVIF